MNKERSKFYEGMFYGYIIGSMITLIPISIILKGVA